MSTPIQGTRKTIVVGVDATPASLGALQHGVKLAKAFDADVVAVFVRRLPTLVGDEPAEAMTVLEESLDEHEQEVKNESEKLLKDSGISWRVQVREGDPGQELLDSAHEEHAVLVVVGAPVHGAVSSIVLASVASYLLHHCDVSFVVVRPKPTEQASN